jgi:hypothetical protein
VKAQLAKDAADLAILGRNQRGDVELLPGQIDAHDAGIAMGRDGEFVGGGALGEFVRIAPCLPSLDMCLHNRKRVLRQQLRAVGEDSNPVGEGFPNRVSEFLLGKNRWRFK